MKKITILSIYTLLVVFLISFSACSKSDSGGGTGGGGGGTTVKGTLNFSFNGSAFNADSVFATGSTYNIKAFQNFSSPSDNKLLDINLNSLATGTYTVNNTAPNIINITIGSTVNYTSQTGTVTITSNTGTVVNGSFTCTVEGGLPLNGSFANVKIR